MGRRPRVSVIIAAYNVEKYIEKSIASALMQSVDDIEIIVIDDASSDRTSSVVRRFVDPRVKLLQNERNKGPAFSRNRGIAHAKGEWIAILDADDWWAPDRLEVLLEIAWHEGAQIVTDDLYLIEDGAEMPWNTYFRSRERVIGPIDKVTEVTAVKMVDDDYGILQPIISRDFLTQRGVRYKEHLIFAEDYVFVLDCLVLGAKMIICPGAYYYYRSRQGSLTNTDYPYTQARHHLLLELATNEPYNQFPDLVDSLYMRLGRLELALKQIRARELFMQKSLLKAILIVVRNPPLLLSYARRIKQGLPWAITHSSQSSRSPLNRVRV